jgi:RNA polymerase sigma factor (sigma-70 family)
MTNRPINRVVQHLRKATLRQDGAGLTDSQLLSHFIEGKDESAFEALVRRHGPMVMGVCRRALHNHHDAEDAFQATFLVLVRKAVSVVPREMVANWLYGVARTTAHRAKAAGARRRLREGEARNMPEPQAPPPDLWDDLRPLLDEELGRLPDKYRVPIILCELEGKSHNDAARQLGWPIGTLSGRLSRARAMLAKRLCRRGVAFSSGALAAVLSQNALACVPTSVLSSTIDAAIVFAAGQAAAAGLISAKVAALTEGVVKSMLLTKLKTSIVVLLATALLATGIGVASFSALQARTADLGAVAGAEVPAQPAGKTDNQRPDLSDALSQPESPTGDEKGKDKAPEAPKDDEALASVGGRVIYNGRPLTDSVIIFHLKDDQFVGARVKDGMFRVDRVPPGAIQVTIESKKVPIPAKFADAETSGLKVEIKKGRNPVNFMLNGPRS